MDAAGKHEIQGVPKNVTPIEMDCHIWVAQWRAVGAFKAFPAGFNHYP